MDRNKLKFRLLFVILLISRICFAADDPLINTATEKITYTLTKATSPTADQLEAYALISKAMDSALFYYNKYSTATKKLTVQYVPSVSTADGNSNGSIRFGSNRSYMVVCTAMHEIGHALGVGTTSQYQNLISNGLFTGKNAVAVLKSIDGESAILKGDKTHFWPYGLNYANEVKSDKDLINNVKIVDAMQMDFYPDRKKPTGTKVFLATQKKKDFLLHDRILECNLHTDCMINLNIFTLNGKNVFKMQSKELNAGTYKIDLGEFPLSKGYYWYTIAAANEQFSGIYLQK